MTRSREGTENTELRGQSIALGWPLSFPRIRFRLHLSEVRTISHLCRTLSRFARRHSKTECSSKSPSDPFLSRFSTTRGQQVPLPDDVLYLFLIHGRYNTSRTACSWFVANFKRRASPSEPKTNCVRLIVGTLQR